MKSVKRWIWALPVIWGGVIIYLSLLPGGAGMLTLFGIPHFDKIGHFGAYAVWAFLWVYALHVASGQTRLGKWIILSALILTGCGLEFGQYCMHAGRSFEYLDMVANGAGAVAGGLTAPVFIRRLKKREANRFPSLPH